MERWRSAPRLDRAGGPRPARPPAPEPAREQPQVPLVRAASPLHPPRRRDGFWIVDVRDYGIGILEELGDDALDVQAGHGDDFEGSGIGRLRRKIVEAHGGAIVAQRADGGGTIMRPSLPATPARGGRCREAAGRDADSAAAAGRPFLRRPHCLEVPRRANNYLPRGR